MGVVKQSEMERNMLILIGWMVGGVVERSGAERVYFNGDDGLR